MADPDCCTDSSCTADVSSLGRMQIAILSSQTTIFLYLAKTSSSIARQRAYIVEMSKSQLPCLPCKVHQQQKKVSIGASPADDQRVGVFITLNLKFRDKIYGQPFPGEDQPYSGDLRIMRDYSCRASFQVHQRDVHILSRPNPCRLLFLVSQIWFEFGACLVWGTSDSEIFFSGTLQLCVPLARYPSESKITGTICSIASWLHSMQNRSS